MSPLKISRYLLYLSLVTGMIPVAREVPIPYMLAALAAIGLNILTGEEKRHLLSNKTITLAVIPLIMLNIYGIRWENLFPRVMAILFLLISAKLLAPKKMRDYLQLYLLSLLLLAGSAVVQWGIEFALLLAAEIIFIIMGLVFLYTYSERDHLSPQETRSITLWGMVMTLALMPTALFFFLILPRPGFNLTPGWAGGKIAKSGFGDRVSPGTVEEIKQDSSVAMRVEWLKGTKPYRNRLYWRGKVYAKYQSGGWSTLKIHVKAWEIAPSSGDQVEYRVILEPRQGKSLFTLGVPIRLRINQTGIEPGIGYTLALESVPRERILYRVKALLVHSYPPMLPPHLFLKVPAEIEKKIMPLALSIAPEEKDPLVLSGAIERYLKSHHGYTMKPGLMGRYPVVSFLLNGEKGHCEYFATAMVLLLRCRHVPARLVAGFLGGEWNNLGHYYTIRNSLAHTWVETYKAGTGWVSFDPTPPAPLETTKRMRTSLAGRLLDYARLQWYRWILSYDVHKQARLLKKVEALFSPSQRPHIATPKIRKGTLVTFIILTAVLLLIMRLFLWLKRRPKTWGEKLVKILEGKGLRHLSGETLLEMAHRLGRDDHALGSKIEEAVGLYYWREYGQGKVDQSTLENLLKEIRSMTTEKPGKDRSLQH